MPLSAGLVDVPLQDGELVSAETGDEIVLAHGRLQSRRNLDQQRVADGVAERVVDVLEAVEIEKEHSELKRRRVARDVNAASRLFQEVAPIGQASERILARQRRDARVGVVELMREADIDRQDQHRGAEEQEAGRGDGNGQPVLIDLEPGAVQIVPGANLRGRHADVMHGGNAGAHGERAEQPLPHDVGHGVAAQAEGEREGERRSGYGDRNRRDDEADIVG